MYIKFILEMLIIESPNTWFVPFRFEKEYYCLLFVPPNTFSDEIWTNTYHVAGNLKFLVINGFLGEKVFFPN
jgi:hypothetical protein